MGVVRVIPYVEKFLFAVEFRLVKGRRGRGPPSVGTQQGGWERCGGFNDRSEADDKAELMSAEEWPGQYEFRVRKL